MLAPNPGSWRTFVPASVGLSGQSGLAAEICIIADCSGPSRQLKTYCVATLPARRKLLVPKQRYIMLRPMIGVHDAVHTSFRHRLPWLVVGLSHQRGQNATL